MKKSTLFTIISFLIICFTTNAREKDSFINIPFSVQSDFNATIVTYSGFGSCLSCIAWDIEYGPEGFVSGQGTRVSNIISTSKKILINKFIKIDIRIRQRFSSSNTSEWSQTQTINQCTDNSYTVGYTTDFNASPFESLCWKGYRYPQTINYQTDSYLYFTNSQYHQNSPGAIQMESNNYSNPIGALLISPKFSDLSTDKKVTFWVKNHYNSIEQNYPTQALKVGTMSDPNDETTFHLLAVIGSNANSNDWEQKTVFFNNYNGNDQYVAIKFQRTLNNSTNTTVYIDDISYEQSVNCFDTSNLNISNLSENAVQLNWDSVGGTQWEVKLKELNLNTELTYLTSTNPYLISNLIGNTNYEVKIRTVCVPGLNSNWSPVLSFTTPCSTISAGYYTSFEETSYVNPCWKKLETISNQISIVQGVYNNDPSTIAPQSGIRELKMQNNHDSPILITPQILDLSSDKRIRFSMFCNGYSLVESSLLIGTMTDPTDASTFSLIETIAPNQMNDLSDAYFPIRWKEYIINFNNYIGTGNYLALKHSNTSFNADAFFIDDFYYETKPSCVQPINQKSYNEKYNEVTLSWDQLLNINATEFQIEYGVSGFVQGTGTILNTTSSPFVVTNIALDNTKYDYYIRSKCGSEYSNWTKKQSFQTKCIGVNAGYTTNFDNQNTNAFDQQCWSRITPYVSSSYWTPNTFISTSSTYVHNGGKSIVLINNSSPNVPNLNERMMLVSPRLIDFDNYKKVKFWLRKENNGLINVGTLSSDNDAATFTPYQNITITQPNQGLWTQYEVDFSNYYGTDKYVGIKFVGNLNQLIYIDDFEYLESGCPKPTSLSAFQSETATETLTWLDNNVLGTTASWELEYGPTGFTTGTLISNIASTSYVLSGLTEGVVYDFRVRANCTASSVSKWSDRYVFRTTCVETAPFNENFDQISSPYPIINSSTCWSFFNNCSSQEYLALEGINSQPNAVSFYKGEDFQTNEIGSGLLVSPYLPDLNAAKKIKFWINRHNSDLPTDNGSIGINECSVVIGTIKNPMDKTTFVPYQNIDISEIDINGKEFEVLFHNYVGTNKHIAISIDGQISEYFGLFFRMDDFKYLENDSCREPINIQATEVTNTTALVSWETISNQNIQIEYGLEGFTIGNGTIINVSNSSTHQLTNLLDSSSYQYYLKTICSGGNSILVGPKTFKTICAPLPLPWIEKFDLMSNYGEGLLPNCFKVPDTGDWITYNAPNYNFGWNVTETGFDDTFFLKVYDTDSTLFTPTFNLYAGTTYTFSLQARKPYQYAGAGILMFTGLGNTYQSMKNSLTQTGSVETEYSDVKFYFTPVISGDYGFYLKYFCSNIPSLIDNLELKEGYANRINNIDNLLTFNFDTSDDKIILEGTQNTTTTIVVDENNSANTIVKMTGSTSDVDWNSNASIWENNQNSISKINMKVDATTATSLFMKFDLKQTFTTNSDESKFRVLVNGIVIDEIDSNFSGRRISEYNSFVYNLTPFVGNDIRISLQHIGKSSNGVGDNAYVDNLAFSPTENLLNNNSFEFSQLKVYPNPTSTILSLENAEVISKVEISNISGQLLYSKNIDIKKVTLDFSIYNTGVYFVKIVANDKNKTIKIIKN